MEKIASFNQLNYNSPKALKAFMVKRGLNFNKKFGQVFLINPKIRQRIVEVIDPKDGDIIWEIGPGLGSLTHCLIDRAAKLVVFELDHGYCRFLNEKWGNLAHFKLVAGDFLRLWPAALTEQRPSKVCGNLPYNIGARIILDLIKAGHIFKKQVFMLQKEVAERLWAKAGQKNYGALSILAQVWYEVKRQGDLKPGAFYPYPRIDSRVVELCPKIDGPKEIGSLFFALIKTLFAQPRKTIKNNLLAGSLDQKPWNFDLPAVWEVMDLNEKRRPAELTIENYLRIGYKLNKEFLKK